MRELFCALMHCNDFPPLEILQDVTLLKAHGTTDFDECQLAGAL